MPDLPWSSPQPRGAAPGPPPVFVLVPEHASFARTWPNEFATLRDALAVAGLSLHPLPMSSPPRDGAVLALLAWGYHFDPGAWLAGLERWESAGAQLLNPAEALRWNTRKTYLIELQAADLPVVPSIAVDHPTPSEIDAARRFFGTDAIVLKPQVGACAAGTSVLRRGAAAPSLERAILQPFLPSVATEGELSLVFLGGAFSHAVRKIPAPGDFRVQAEHGGRVLVVEPPLEALAAAHALLEAAPRGLLYARVDMILDRGGSWRLMELELIEPQLFLGHSSRARESMGFLLRRALQG